MVTALVFPNKLKHILLERMSQYLSMNSLQRNSQRFIKDQNYKLTGQMVMTEIYKMKVPLY